MPDKESSKEPQPEPQKPVVVPKPELPIQPVAKPTEPANVFFKGSEAPEEDRVIRVDVPANDEKPKTD